MSGIVFNGLYLVQKEPSQGDKGLLVNGKYFIPVTNESSGAVASYYKCTAVSSGAAQPEGYNLTMSFLDVIDFDYATEPTVIQLTMTDSTKTGLDREWVSADGGYTLKKYVSPYEGHISWGLYANNGDIYTHYVSLGLLDQNKITVNDEGNSVDQRDPWEITQLYSDTGFMDTGTITWTVSEASQGEKAWSGYKAVFDSAKGTWSFESGVTAGLAYTNVTPIVGGIYSADALVIVSLLYTGTPTLTSPTGMTSESSDEWEISAKSNYNAYYPWKAFDGLSSPFTNCWSSQTAKDQWLQWHNKKQKVLVQRLKLSVTDAPAQGPAEFILQGSDDGTLWHDIHSESGLSWTTNGEAKEFAFSNNKSYYYHRLNEMWADSNVVSILELETYDL